LAGGLELVCGCRGLDPPPELRAELAVA
jgi:hypothetical protein